MFSRIYLPRAYLRFALFFCCLLVASAMTKSASAVILTFNNFADFQAATQSLTVETFENAPWVNGENPNATVSLGLTWTAEAELFAETSIARSGARSLSDGDEFPNFQEQINAELPLGTTAVGAFVDTFGEHHGVRMTASAQSDSLLAAVEGPMTAAGSFSSFLGIISTEIPIARISFVLNVDQIEGNNFAVDDVYFGQAAVPEPASIAIFGFGLAALSAARRRKGAWLIG